MSARSSKTAPTDPFPRPLVSSGSHPVVQRQEWPAYPMRSNRQDFAIMLRMEPPRFAESRSGHPKTQFSIVRLLAQDSRPLVQGLADPFPAVIQAMMVFLVHAPPPSWSSLSKRPISEPEDSSPD